MLRKELLAFGTKDPARGIKSPEGLAERPALAVCVSRANSNFEGKDVMPRPRTPREKARITGADRNQPSRLPVDLYPIPRRSASRRTG